MAKSKQKRRLPRQPQVQNQPKQLERQQPADLSKLEKIPVTYQELLDYFGKYNKANPFALRLEVFRRIEQITKRPLICYVTKTRGLLRTDEAYIDHSDLVGFSDLIRSVGSDSLDIFLVSNGGSAEATERIVQLLRGQFNNLRFIIPSNAFSAATLLCFAGDEILMNATATLGPIDPQINGIPARAIQRAFEEIERRLSSDNYNYPVMTIKNAH